MHQWRFCPKWMGDMGRRCISDQEAKYNIICVFQDGDRQPAGTIPTFWI